MTLDLWKLVSVRLEIVSVQDRCTVCAKRTIGLDNIFNAPMVLQGDEAQVEAHFSLCGDSANLDARLVRSLRRTYHRLGNQFGHSRWNSYVMWVLWNPVSDHLEILLVSVQDRCTVCAKRTIGLDIVFNASMVLLGDEVQVEARFSPFGDSANLDAR